MIKAGQMMESQYGHLFEKVIVNDDLSAAFGELYQALRKVENEAHWVPVSWTHSWDPDKRDTMNWEKGRALNKNMQVFIFLCPLLLVSGVKGVTGI